MGTTPKDKKQNAHLVIMKMSFYPYSTFHLKKEKKIIKNILYLTQVISFISKLLTILKGFI